QAAVLNWQGNDKFGAQLRGHVACCYPPEIRPADAEPFVQDCQAALQDAASPREALAPLARLHGEMVKLSGSLKGVSEECDVGILYAKRFPPFDVVGGRTTSPDGRGRCEGLSYWPLSPGQGLQRADRVGGAVMLIHRRVLKTIPAPWFTYLSTEPGAASYEC